MMGEVMMSCGVHVIVRCTNNLPKIAAEFQDRGGSWGRGLSP